MPAEVGGWPIKPWQKTAFSYFTTRPGLELTLIVIEGKGDDGKSKLQTHLVSLPGKVGTMFENKKDFKKIEKLTTLSFEDELAGKEVRLDFICIDYTKEGDTRRTDSEHYRDLEKLLNGSRRPPYAERAGAPR